MRTKKEALEKKIIQLQLKQEEDKKTRDEEEKRLREENTQLGIKRDELQTSNEQQLMTIAGLIEKTETIEGTTKKEVEETMGEQIKALKAEKEKLMKLKDKEKTELSTEIEELGERVKKSESKCKRLQQEKVEKYINCKRRKYKATKLMVP